MRKNLSKILSVALAVLMIVSALPLWAGAADTVVATGKCGESLTWELFDDGTFVVLGNGEMPIANNSSSMDIYRYRDSIKKLIISEGVTTVYADWFSNCSNLTQVQLPDTLEYFYDMFDMTSIKELYFPASVKYIETGRMSGGMLERFIVDENNPYFSTDEHGILYNKDKTELLIVPVNIPLTSLTIPDGVERIEVAAFAVNLNIKEVIMPDSMKEIGDYAFIQAPYVEKVTIPEGVEIIGLSAFVACGKLDNVIVPASVKSIGFNAFGECYSLRNLTILSKDAEMAEMAFGYLSYAFDSDEMRTEIADLFAYFMYKSYAMPFDEAELDEIEKKVFAYPTREESDMTKDTCTVYCYDGSTAHTFAVENGVNYVLMCDHTEEVLEAVAPTCTEAGLSEGKYCSKCGEVFTAQEELEATGHDMTEWVNDYDAGIAVKSCKNCDYTETVELTQQGGGDVEIVAPENPELDFVVENIDKNGDTFLLVEDVVKDNYETECEVLKVFDITLKNHDGVHVQPDGTVKVKLPLDWEKDGNYKVYRVNDDGTLTDMQAFRQGSHMVFETDHFSIYVIVEEGTDENKDIFAKKDVFGFLTKLIRALEAFFMKVLTALGF